MPFLEPLLQEGIERGKTVGVFFAPSSEWRLIVTATVASRLQANLKAGIITTTRFPKEIQADLKRFGVDVEKAVQVSALHIADWYTCITGRVPTEVPDDMPVSLKVEELGLISSKYWHTGKGTAPDSLPDFVEFALFDNLTKMFNYNDGVSCIRFLNTLMARMKQDTRATMVGFATEVLDKKEYSNLESMFDGIIDVSTVEAGGALHTMVRVRSFPDVRHTKGWHAVMPQPDALKLVPASQAGIEIHRAADGAENTHPPWI